VTTRRRETRPIKVLLADDHQVVRQGIRALLESEEDIVVVGEAVDGRRAVELAKKLRPDVVVMDIAMPRLNGLEATRQILEAAPNMRVLVLSAHSDEEYVSRIRELGGAGYLLKQSSLSQMTKAIREARAGKLFVGPPQSPGRSPSTSTGVPRLTKREAEVLQLIVEGRANKETAGELGISIKTVEKHRQSLMTKLDIHDVAGLTHFAIATGVVELRTGRSSA
jgi:two-component system, NarL family, nitrate/nitrite response regulator NarL